MGAKTSIEWTRGQDGTAGATWNPVTGCDKVSPGCDHCYAETLAHRFAGTPAYPHGFAVTLRPDRLDQPLRWTRPRNVFVNSMSDLLHADVPDSYIAHVFAVMSLAPRHTFQVLTKRHGRLRSLLRSEAFIRSVRELAVTTAGSQAAAAAAWGAPDMTWPIPNVWVGVSAEDQKWADVRIPALLETPAAVRFVSAEPLLGPLVLNEAWVDAGGGVDWLIVGGESGPGARALEGDWVRALRDQCKQTPVAFFFKQWGGLRAKANGRELDGCTHDDRPGASERA